MILEHFFIPKIAHSSYMLISGDVCAVVDPARNIDIYLKAAGDLGLRIEYILETHLHADFLSGHMDLAEATGARIVVPGSAECDFPHMAVSSGDALSMGRVRFDVLETPGHTPEHVSYVVSDLSRGTAPVGVFTGDTLFVGDAGRPDLFPGRALELAEKLFDSLEILRELPDHCEVWPAHGAGSLCGRAVGAKYTSTIGYEKLYNPPLNMGREELVKSLTENMPPAPDHFSRCSEINRRGPEKLRGRVLPPALTPMEFSEAMKTSGRIVVDLRDPASFASCHIPGSLNISVQGNFPTFAGWILPPESELLFVAESREQALHALEAAMMVGEFKVAGYLTGGLFTWSLRGLPMARFNLLLPCSLKEFLGGYRDLQLVDTRSPGEFSGGTIGNAVNISAPDLRVEHSSLDSKRDTLLFCSSGHRSSLAASMLESRGFRSLFVLNGGTAAWREMDD